MDAAVKAEAQQYGDIVRLDAVDTYADLPTKALKLFSALPDIFDADFYFKVDDDVILNIPALASYLRPRRHQGNLYMVLNPLLYLYMLALVQPKLRIVALCWFPWKVAEVQRPEMGCLVLPSCIIESYTFLVNPLGHTN